MRDHGLLARTIPCHRCSGSMFLKIKADRNGGEVFRCRNNRAHQKAIRTFSFFEKIHIEIQDVIVFIKSYLDKMTLLQCSVFSGIDYGSTACNWASYMRELFKEYFHRHIRHRRIGGEIEIDESLFGRRVKFHRGNPNKGLKVWIFGLIDRGTNTVILYPVSDRTEATLLPIIQRHVIPGSTIYSDGWSAYYNLNDAGYRHFTVLHKYAFKKEYRNTATGAIVTVHTNRIEGAWKHAKDHFRRIVGTKSQQFEGHLAEIMWRSDSKGQVYEKFFELLQEVFPLDKAADYEYTTPLFDSWGGPEILASGTEEDKVIPVESGAETDSETEELVVSTSRRPMPNPRSAMFPSGANVSLHSSAESADRTVVAESPPRRTSPRKNDGNRLASPATNIDTPTTVRRRTGGPNLKVTKRKQPYASVSKTDNVRHPAGFEQVTIEKKKKRVARRSNPYARDAFVWDSENDDDFDMSI